MRVVLSCSLARPCGGPFLLIASEDAALLTMRAMLEVGGDQKSYAQGDEPHVEDLSSPATMQLRMQPY